MRPVLFELGPLEVKAYGTFIALAFVAAWLVLRHELDRRGARGDVAGHLAIAAAIGGFIGARAYWLLEHPTRHRLATRSQRPALPGTAASSAAHWRCC